MDSKQKDWNPDNTTLLWHSWVIPGVILYNKGLICASEKNLSVLPWVYSEVPSKGSTQKVTCETKKLITGFIWQT